MKQHQLEIANDFFWDCFDLYQRYKLSNGALSVRKSGRLKCFIDLRVAYECILKAGVVYFNKSENDRENLIQMVQSYQHNTDRLEKDVIQFLPEKFRPEIEFFSEDIKNLPIGLRYRLDTMDYIDAFGDGYYKTVGQDYWIDRFAELVGNISEHVGNLLNSHSRIVSFGDVFEPGDLLKREFNKYDLKRNTGNKKGALRK